MCTSPLWVRHVARAYAQDKVPVGVCGEFLRADREVSDIGRRRWQNRDARRDMTLVIPASTRLKYFGSKSVCVSPCRRVAAPSGLRDEISPLVLAEAEFA